MDPDEVPDNQPDLDGVEYNFAVEHSAKMFRDFKDAGLSTDEAAAILAAILMRTNQQ